MSVIFGLSVLSCFNNQWKSYGGVGWGCKGLSDRYAKIVMTHDISSDCPGWNESHDIRIGESAIFNNKWRVVVNSVYDDGSVNSRHAIVEIFDMTSETTEKTAKINEFAIFGNSPYMVGSMTNFELVVEWLASTSLCVAICFGYMEGDSWRNVGPISVKNYTYNEGTLVRFKGAMTVNYAMLDKNDKNIAMYFIITDNETGIEQDCKFIPITVCEKTYPDDDPIWEDPTPDPVDPVDPVDPRIPDIKPVQNDMWIYIVIAGYIGILAVMLWSSR